jgi:penicillin-binding protein 1B
VWVGFDDYSDLRLSGATTAAPIWADFMKRAVRLPEYREVEEFRQPPGVVDVQLDKATNRVATAACPETYAVAFIAGTEPKDTCDQALGEHRGILSRIFGTANPAPPPPVIGAHPATGQAMPAVQPEPANSQKKKKGLFGKIVGIFKDDKPSPPPAPQQRPQ